MKVSDFQTLPMDLSHDEIASLLTRLIALNPSPLEGARLIGSLYDRQQLLWKPFNPSSLAEIDQWLTQTWRDDLKFVDASATLIVSLDLPRALQCLQTTADRADDAAIARVAREALAER